MGGWLTRENQLYMLADVSPFLRLMQTLERLRSVPFLSHFSSCFEPQLLPSPVLLLLPLRTQLQKKNGRGKAKRQPDRVRSEWPVS